jgi:hypothetical protein
MSILKKLYHGEIDPCGKPVGQDPELAKIHKQIDVLQDKITKDFTDEHKKDFDDYLCLLSSSSVIEEEDFFMAGFKLGSRLFAESMFSTNLEMPSELTRACKHLLFKQDKQEE